MSKVDSTGTRTYLRDGAYLTDPVLSDGAATYTPAISERRSSTTTFYHAGIKNGDSQTSTGQSVTASVQYDAFGNVTSSSGAWSGPFAYGGPYGYQSDPDSGLKLLGHRYYDPSTGRFLTRDPIKDGRNWYSYCGNNPLRFVDPTGCLLVLILAGAGVVAGIYGLIELGKYMTEKVEEGRRNRDAMMYLFNAGDDVGYEGGRKNQLQMIREVQEFTIGQYEQQYGYGLILTTPTYSGKPSVIVDGIRSGDVGSFADYFDKHYKVPRVIYEIPPN